MPLKSEEDLGTNVDANAELEKKESVAGVLQGTSVHMTGFVVCSRKMSADFTLDI